MLVKCPVGVYCFATFFLCGLVLVECSPSQGSCQRPAAGVVLPWLKPHISGGMLDLPSLSWDPRYSMSLCGWKLPVGTSGPPGRGREGAWVMAPPRVQKEVSEHQWEGLLGGPPPGPESLSYLPATPQERPSQI